MSLQNRPSQHLCVLWAISFFCSLGEGLRLRVVHYVEVEMENPVVPPRIPVWNSSGYRREVGADSIRAVYQKVLVGESAGNASRRLFGCFRLGWCPPIKAVTSKMPWGARKLVTVANDNLLFSGVFNVNANFFGELRHVATSLYSKKEF